MSENELSDYIDSIAGVEPTDNGADNGEGQPNTGTPDNTPTDDTTQDNNEGVENREGSEQADQQQDDQNQQSEQTRQEPQTPKYQRRPSGDYVDQKGNIVDAQGRIIAPSGESRRFYERAQSLDKRNRQLTERYNNLERQYKEVQLLNGEAQRRGLSNEDVAFGLDVASRIKTDVVGLTKDLVARMVAAGHNVSELLGKEVGDSVDMRAISLMIDDRLGPVKAQREAAERQQRQNEEAQRLYTEFVNNNPYADVQGDDIAALINHAAINGEQMTPQKAYNTLRDYAYKHGLDFTQPLGAQVQERQNHQMQQQQRRNGTVQARQRPLPGNGAQTRRSGVEQPSIRYADSDDSWSNIIQSTLNE